MATGNICDCKKLKVNPLNQSTGCCMEHLHVNFIIMLVVISIHHLELGHLRLLFVGVKYQ